MTLSPQAHNTATLFLALTAGSGALPSRNEWAQQLSLPGAVRQDPKPESVTLRSFLTLAEPRLCESSASARTLLWVPATNEWTNPSEEVLVSNWTVALSETTNKNERVITLDRLRLSSSADLPFDSESTDNQGKFAPLLKPFVGMKTVLSFDKTGTRTLVAPKYEAIVENVGEALTDQEQLTNLEVIATCFEPHSQLTFLGLEEMVLPNSTTPKKVGDKWTTKSKRQIPFAGRCEFVVDATMTKSNGKVVEVSFQGKVVADASDASAPSMLIDDGTVKGTAQFDASSGLLQRVTEERVIKYKIPLIDEAGTPDDARCRETATTTVVFSKPPTEPKKDEKKGK